MSDTSHWVKAAFFKLARLGAIVFLPTSDGKYLMQVADEEDESAEGKLRPPGGGQDTKDKNLTATIIRELGEEFALPKSKIKKNLRFLGYEYRDKFWGNAVFELCGHGLKPGVYQASNDPEERVRLVEAKLDDKRYVGPDPDKLLNEKERGPAAAVKSARFITYKELEEYGKQAKGKLVRVYMHDPGTDDTHSITTALSDGETPEAAAIRTVKHLKKLDVDETAIERMPSSEDGDKRVRVLLPATKKASAQSESVADKFTPDLTPEQMEEMAEVQARLYHRTKPHLASMKVWPADWSTADDAKGWVEWYHQYHGGRRSVHDEKQIKRWRSFKSRHGSPFVKNPTPRRAWSLVNWGIDPLKMLPEGAAREEFKKEMDAYKAKVDGGSVKSARTDGGRFRMPENFDKIKDLSTRDFVVEAGGNDWEDTWSGVTITFSNGKRVWAHLDIPESLSSEGGEKKPGEDKDWGRRIVEKWIAAADDTREKFEDGSKYSWKPEDFTDTADDIPGIKEFGIERMVWQSVKESSVSVIDLDANEELLEDMARMFPSVETGAIGIYKLAEIHGEKTIHLPGCEHEKQKTAPKNIDRKQLAKGTTEELEHTSVIPMARGTAVDHLLEDPFYYDHLQEMKEKHQPGERKQAGLFTAEQCYARARQEFEEANGRPPADDAETLKWIQEEMMLQPEPGSKVASADNMCGRRTWACGCTSNCRCADISRKADPEGHKPRHMDEDCPLCKAGVKKKKAEVVKSATVLDQNPVDPTIAAGDQEPVTGPEAIYRALENMDLDAKQAEAMDIVRRKLKSKRPDAVKVLGYIDGLKRMGYKPHELMLRRVPVIPPQFRPFSVAGETFVPGDANELYRDLINLIGVHKELQGKLGSGSNFNKLNIYDAVSALYGYADPTSPKTRERGVSGFLRKVTGVNPKFSFFQRKMLSKDQDYVGRGVIGVDPDLGLDQIGVPDDMMWTLYAPYIQRHLVRSGMSPEEALRAVRDRTTAASKVLDEHAKERPVVYSRAPSWHKFNVIAGYPKRIKGDMIRINPLVTTGLNADFDGDTLNIHLPSMPDSVRDAKEKLLPSKMLFSIKDPTKVMPVPKQEFIMGLFNAQRRPAKNVHSFPDEQSALAAIRNGKVALSDEIKIGKAV